MKLPDSEFGGEVLAGRRSRRAAIAVIGSVVAVGATGFFAKAQAETLAPGGRESNAEATAENPYAHRIPAPRLSRGDWVNIEAALSLGDLRGRFVLLDFWTFCCINCMHILPELKKLEHAFPNELVVIGVHSAKFEGEQATDNIREAVERYEIEHPVLNDLGMKTWNTYGVRSWPTLVLIDPEGHVVWAAAGERDFEEIKAVIDAGLPYYRAQGLLKPAPRPTVATTEQLTPLKFPGKILADEPGGRLFISDSNHNRIVVTDLDGRVQIVLGSGAIGRDDGGFEDCSFKHPQGMALVKDVLYIADTENHLLRKADLKSRQVTTIAGTGNKGNGLSALDESVADDDKAKEGAKNPLRNIALASPWALWHHEGDLYIAMAGRHQIWRMPLDESSIGPYAGNGREDIVDGPLLPNVPYDANFASFAQPSGLTSDGKRLFVADSEGSTVRAVPFDSRGKVETLVGLTGTLFDFGDVDGAGGKVRLQHPLDVAWWDDKLYVADTYNNKIKVIDVKKRSCKTLAGSGKPGNADADAGDAAMFNEPEGLTAADGKLYVADTNNHSIRVVELAAPHKVTTLKIDQLAAPAAK
jgi:thiol-disulfide isomerase/thioredoxin